MPDISALCVQAEPSTQELMSPAHFGLTPQTTSTPKSTSKPQCKLSMDTPTLNLAVSVNYLHKY